MSKPTSHNVHASLFKIFFGFTPCYCHEDITTAGSAFYRIDYVTKSYTADLKEIKVTCDCCGRSETRDVEHLNIDGNDLPF